MAVDHLVPCLEAVIVNLKTIRNGGRDYRDLSCIPHDLVVSTRRGIRRQGHQGTIGVFQSDGVVVNDFHDVMCLIGEAIKWCLPIGLIDDGLPIDKLMIGDGNLVTGIDRAYCDFTIRSTKA